MNCYSFQLEIVFVFNWKLGLFGHEMHDCILIMRWHYVQTTEHTYFLLNGSFNVLFMIWTLLRMMNMFDFFVKTSKKKTNTRNLVHSNETFSIES